MRVFFLCILSFIYLDNHAQQPNILWLTCEDMSLYLGSYGHPNAATPNLDSLAEKGIRFTRAYSNGVQCSPARSTLISGVYAPNLATDWHRQGRAVPDSFYFPIYLRRLGYYCTNNSKKDYNASQIPTHVWDQSDNTASWVSAPQGKPFFAVYNSGITHMTRVVTRTTDGRSPRNIQPFEVNPPPILPNTGEVRDDYAWHLDAVANMDSWIGERLQELQAAGKDDSTIIFFFSDHGGCLPGSKAYVSERGGRVPMLAYFPPAFAHLAPVNQPAVIDSFMQFIDLGASMIQLAGGKVPDYMEGRAVLGSNRTSFRNEVFLFRTNQGDNFIPSRALINDRYHMVWNFNTAYPQGARQSYQWQMPAFMSWEKACLAGQCDSIQAAFWKPMSTFELYDLDSDPNELHNLAYNPQHAQVLEDMKTALLAQLKSGPDLGFFPKNMRQRSSSTPFYDIVRNQSIDVDAVIDAAAFASQASSQDLPQLELMLDDPQAPVRYWAAMGLNRLISRKQIDTLSSNVYTAWSQVNEEKEIRLILAEALIRDGQDCEPLSYILNEAGKNQGTANMVLQNLGAKARRLESRIIDLKENGQNVSRFMLRGALINSGNLPYEALYDNQITPIVINEDTTCLERNITPIDAPKGTGFHIYPNPFKDQIFIKSLNGTIPKEICMTDVHGKSINCKSRMIHADTYAIEWPINCSPGLYILNIQGNSPFSHKLLKH